MRGSRRRTRSKISPAVKWLCDRRTSSSTSARCVVFRNCCPGTTLPNVIMSLTNHSAMVPCCFRLRQLRAPISCSGPNARSRACLQKEREWRLNRDRAKTACGGGTNPMESSWTVAVTREIPDAGLRPLREATKVKLWDQALPPSAVELDELLEGCDGAITLLTDHIDGSVIDRHPSLRVISNFAVGYDNIDVPAATERGVRSEEHTS